MNFIKERFKLIKSFIYKESLYLEKLIELKNLKTRKVDSFTEDELIIISSNLIKLINKINIFYSHLFFHFYKNKKCRRKSILDILVYFSVDLCDLSQRVSCITLKIIENEISQFIINDLVSVIERILELYICYKDVNFKKMLSSLYLVPNYYNINYLFVVELYKSLKIIET